MSEENTGTMNLDLNLGPFNNNSSDDNDPGSRSYPDVAMNLEDWLDVPVDPLREVISHRRRSLWRHVPIPLETRNLALELIGINPSQTGDGSVATEELPDEALELAKDPVLTCCGHLYCWPCLYRWLHLHSDAKECPVCKGEVTVKNVTPIYGRTNTTRDTEVDSSLKIPIRPQARRVESWRQTIQRTVMTVPMEEMIRRLGSTFDLSRELAQLQSQNPDNPREPPDDRIINQILTSRAMRRERAPSIPIDDVIIDLTETSPPNYEPRDNRRLSALLLRRSNAHRAANLTSVLNSAESLAAESLVESYFHSIPLVRNHNRHLPLPLDDRDSVSSIAAVIQSESQTVDNAIEIDSRVSLSTSSSRRRNDGSRISDVDSGDSRAPRRRRLN
ncbi:hypothetical protein ACJIZ3_025783 [Penstemon smallii]|uniref:E3 ubiquitin-protein ligase RMA n=1 Tax=Penstemon smallii TaxID=265156 RepID=A0ABD3TY99_9LAMI